MNIVLGGREVSGRNAVLVRAVCGVGAVVLSVVIARTAAREGGKSLLRLLGMVAVLFMAAFFDEFFAHAKKRAEDRKREYEG